MSSGEAGGDSSKTREARRAGAAAGLTSDATTLAQMAAPSTPRAPLIIGGDQPEGYIYVSLNHGLSVWGHVDVVPASVTEPDSESGQTAKHI